MKAPDETRDQQNLIPATISKALFFFFLGGGGGYLGFPVLSFCPFSFWVPLLKPNSREKGTPIIKGLLGNLVMNGSTADLKSWILTISASQTGSLSSLFVASC